MNSNEKFILPKGVYPMVYPPHAMVAQQSMYWENMKYATPQQLMGNMMFRYAYPPPGMEHSMLPFIPVYYPPQVAGGGGGGISAHPQPPTMFSTGEYVHPFHYVNPAVPFDGTNNTNQELSGSTTEKEEVATTSTQP